VSSVAATYRDTTLYHYADSKAEAEESVRMSGLPYVILRPTLVLGRNSPMWVGLATLAGLPVMPIFGNGTVRTQPVYVGDVVKWLLKAVNDRRGDGRAIGFGGPDVVSVETLLRRIRRKLRGKDSGVVHVPAVPAISLLASVDRWLGSRLPITAGQLSLFVNDSTAVADASTPETVPEAVTLDQMISLSASNGA
jgi:NADH dehydrogenase